MNMCLNCSTCDVPLWDRLHVHVQLIHSDPGTKLIGWSVIPPAVCVSATVNVFGCMVAAVCLRTVIFFMSIAVTPTRKGWNKSGLGDNSAYSDIIHYQTTVQSPTDRECISFTPVEECIHKNELCITLALNLTTQKSSFFTTIIFT